MTVDFAIYCYEGDKERLFDEFQRIYLSHGYDFNKIHIIHQRTKPLEGWGKSVNLVEIKEEEYDDILRRYNINPDDQEAEHYTHGWSSAHYYKHHLVNHLTALEQSIADYIVLSDSDCWMTSNNGWVNKAIEFLKSDRSILVVSPNDGSKDNKIQRMSQQLFLCERERLKNIDWSIPFEGFPPNGPMPEYWWMCEGRIGKYMEKNNLYRKILESDNRYWHTP